MRSIFLHIGQPKTGTSAIQSFLKANRPLLEEGGVVYPHHCHHLSRLWDGAGEKIDASRRAWADLENDIQRSDKDFVISNEGLDKAFVITPESVDTINSRLGVGTIRIVLYLRRQDLHLESYYRQIVRGEPHVAPFAPTVADEMVFPGYYDYAARIRTLETLFGRGNLIIRVYDRNAFHGGCLVRDFCHALGLRWNEAFTLPPPEDNPSMDARLTDLMLKANKRLTKSNGSLREFKELLDCVEAFTFPNRENRLLSATDRIAMMKRYEEGNRWIARRYFQREELFDLTGLDSMGEPETLTEQELYDLLLNLNAAWARGIGAVPLSTYNKLKIAHLEIKTPSTHGIKQRFLHAETLLLKALSHLFIPRLPQDGQRCPTEKSAMRYIRKNAELIREKGSNLLD
ncbi:MAG: hypothetical protein V3571_00355 [Pseudodesulfovibrio sp.]